MIAAQPAAPPPAATPPAAAKPAPRRKVKPSCERCYFGRRGLCALELSEPCSTFRPDSPYGLLPPTQPMLLFRGEAGAAPTVELAGAAA